jgi:hypothetical protein
VSIVRGDDAMLVTPYMRFFVGSNSPTFEFRAREAPKMFTRCTRHLDATWTNAEDWRRIVAENLPVPGVHPAIRPSGAEVARSVLPPCFAVSPLGNKSRIQDS